MFCVRCGKSFEPYFAQISNYKKEISFCKKCLAGLYAYKDVCFVGKDTFCRLCGSVIEKKVYEKKSGKKFTTSAFFKECQSCKDKKEKESRFKKCATCDTILENKRKKYCEVCRAKNPLKKSNNKNSHRKAAIKWQKSNPKKSKAAHLARYYPEKVSVLYECACNSENKVNHHFDYSRPFEVIRLCPSCHVLEHLRLKKHATKKEEN